MSEVSVCSASRRSNGLFAVDSKVDSVVKWWHERGYQVPIPQRGLDTPTPAPGNPNRHPARRWVVARTHSWFNRLRHLSVRREKKAEHYMNISARRFSLLRRYDIDRQSEQTRVSPLRLALMLIGVGAYVLLFFPLYSRLGLSVTTLAVFPVGVAAWLWGLWAGLVAGLLGILLNTLLANLAGREGWGALIGTPGGALGAAVMVLTGMVIGRLRDLEERARREIAKRKHAEERLAKLNACLLGLLQGLTDQAAQAIADARLFAESQQRATEMTAFQETALDLVSHPETRPLLETIVHRATELLGASSGLLYQWDESLQRLRCTISHNLSRDYTNVTLQPGEGTAGRVYQTGQPLVVNDYAHWEGRAVHLRDMPSRAVICAPILWRGQVIGAIDVNDESGARAFDDQDVRLLGLFANQAAIAIENVRLYAAVQRELAERSRSEQALRRRDAILEAVSFAAERFLRAPSWQENIQEVLERLGRATEVSRVYIFENHTGEDGSLLTSQRYEWAAPGITPQRDNPELQSFPWRAGGFARWEETLGRGELIDGHVRDFPESERAILVPQDIQSIAVVPIFLGQTWWGFIGFDACRVEREWSAVEKDALKTAADTLGAALQQQQVAAELQTYARQQAALVKISAHLATTLDETDMCQKVVRGLHDTLGYDYVGLFLVDQTTGERVLYASVGWRDALRNWRIPPGQGVSEYALLSGQLHYTPDVTRDPRYLPGIGTGAEVDVPIRIGEQVVGVLVVESERPCAFDQHDFSVLTAAANQTSLALQRAREHQAVKETVKALEQRNRETTLLGEMGNLFQACQTAEEAYTIIARSIQQLFPTEAGALYVCNASRNLVEAVATWGEPLAPEHAFEPGECWALRRGRLHLVEDPQSALVCRHVEATRQALSRSLCVPMMARGETLGVLMLRRPAAVGNGEPKPFPESRQQLAVTVAEHTALVLANLKLRETLRHQAIRDPLTNLFHRRYMEETLERELNRAQRKGTPLGIMMLDIDHFKNFNDIFGHDAGDTLLRELGLFLQTHIRQEDIACRYGGEEFLLIFPEASLDDTRQRAEELRAGVKTLNVRHRGQLLGAITLSFGIAVFPKHGGVAEALLRAADRALYRAKAEGRDRVVVEGDR